MRMRLSLSPQFFNLFFFCYIRTEAIKDMSSDTAKENASVVDSSVTEWKQDMENLDDQGNR